jgi:predicted permease
VVPVLSSSFMDRDVHVEGYDAGAGADRGSAVNEVGPGYFRTLGIPVLAGRGFTAADALGSPPVAVVNQAFARKFRLGTDPVGRYMSFGGSDSLNVKIVGIVADAKYNSVKDPVPPLVFTPWRQNASVGSLAFYLRSDAPAAQLFHAIPALLLRLAPAVPLEDLKTMPQQVRENEFVDRMTSMLAGIFAALATVLAAIGLYGVMAYAVQQRTREIGIRMALGADPWKVRAMVVRQLSVMIGIGAVAGAGLALAVGRLLQAQLFGLEGDDPVVFALSLAALALVAFVATYVPVRRASRVDPVEALRYE